MNRCLMTDTVLVKRKSFLSSYGYGCSLGDGFGSVESDYETILDTYGEPISIWETNATTVGRLENLSVKETLGGSGEQLGNINIAMATHIVYLPPDTSVNEQDRLEIDSTTYEIKQVIAAKGFRDIDHYEVRVVELR